MERTGRMPNMIQAGTYSAVLQYLKAIDKAGTDETEAVAKELHSMPVNDVFTENGKVQSDGNMVHDMYLYQVKKPEESKKDWDYYPYLAPLPGDKAFLPAAESACDLKRRRTTTISKTGGRWCFPPAACGVTSPASPPSTMSTSTFITARSTR